MIKVSEFNKPLLKATYRLNQNTTDQGRYYTVGESPRKYYSVTTILSKTADSTGLKEWRDRVGHQEAAKISTAATQLGTKLHKLMESLLENTWTLTQHPDLNFRFKSVKNFLETNVSELLGSELPVYSRAMQIAGTVDLVYRDNEGEIIVADLKTAKAPKRPEYYADYFLQIAAYSLCLSEHFNIFPTKGLILFSYPEYSSPVWFDPTDYFELFYQRLQQFHNLSIFQETACASV